VDIQTLFQKASRNGVRATCFVGLMVNNSVSAEIQCSHKSSRDEACCLYKSTVD